MSVSQSLARVKSYAQADSSVRVSESFERNRLRRCALSTFKGTKGARLGHTGWTRLDHQLKNIKDGSAIFARATLDTLKNTRYHGSAPNNLGFAE